MGISPRNNDELARRNRTVTHISIRVLCIGLHTKHTHWHWRIIVGVGGRKWVATSSSSSNALSFVDVFRFGQFVHFNAKGSFLILNWDITIPCEPVVRMTMTDRHSGKQVPESWKKIVRYHNPPFVHLDWLCSARDWPQAPVHTSKPFLRVPRATSLPRIVHQRHFPPPQLHVHTSCPRGTTHIIHIKYVNTCAHRKCINTTNKYLHYLFGYISFFFLYLFILISLSVRDCYLSMENVLR